ncbi:MAG: SDR family NAD(P)-dependent oxidoreductase [Bacteroidota bacterium]
MNYLFAGASSAIAKSCAQLLQNKGHVVTGFSRGNSDYSYDRFFEVETYRIENLPEIDGTVDGIVYFPGSINLKPFHRITRDELLNEFEINVVGATEVIKKYLPLLKQSPNASIVLISSVAATAGMPFHASVSISKAGIEGLTRALAAELAPAVRVNCVAPSLVNTPLAERFLNTAEKEFASKNRNPLKKVGKPEDIASMISYLLSEDAGWISGQTFSVDGGMNNLRV